MAAAMAGGDYVSDQPSCGSGERRGRAVEESRLRCPPDDVVTADPPRAPRAPAARDEYLAARFVELFRELAARLGAADDEHRAGGKSGWVRVFLSQQLKHRRGQLFGARRPVCPLIRAGRDHHGVRPELLVRQLEDEVSVVFLE